MDYAAMERVTLLVDTASGFLFLALGIWILFLKPRRPATLALGVFAAAVGIHVAVQNMESQLDWLSARWEPVEWGAGILAGAALVVLSLLFPRPLEAGARARVLAAPLALAVAQLSALFLDRPSDLTPITLIEGLGNIGVYACTWFALALFAVRYAHARSPEEHRALAIVSVAVALDIVTRLGIAIIAEATGPSLHPSIALATVSLVGLIALWLRNTARGGPAERARARTVALFFPSLLVAAGTFAALTEAARAFNLGPMGLVRIAGVLILSWAILRGLLPGLDARVRWGISRSSTAAAFIVVFFVTSETTQQFFGDTTGSAYLGIAAAGALVFAIAPLQRAAERLAEKAVPVTTGPSAAPGASKAHEDAYKAAVRFALRSGISRAEEIELARIAEVHALSPLRALQLRHEVEEAMGQGGTT